MLFGNLKFLLDKWGGRFGVFLALSLCVYLGSQLDIENAAQQVKRISNTAMLIVIVTISGNLVFSCVRLGVILKDFGFRPGARPILRATFLGGLGGLIFFQVVGQTLTRLAILKRAGVSGAATLSLSIYERMISIGVLGALALSGALYQFGRVSVEMNNGGGAFLVIVSCGFAAAIFSLWFGYRPLIRYALRAVNGKVAMASVLRGSGITLAMHCLMLAAYVAIGASLKPDLSLTDLVAASTIVMFAAALPISFGGWGIRELSAVYVYGAIGIGLESAVIIAVIIGVVSQLLLASAAAMSAILPARTKPQAIGQSDAGLAGPQPMDFQVFLFWALPLAAASAVFFQIKVPVRDHLISFNLADPIVMLGALVFLVQRVRKAWVPPFWRVRRLEPILLGLTLAFVISFAIGWSSFGITNWALFNRLAGWSILLCYLATGAVAVSAFGTLGCTLVVRTFAVSAAGVTMAVLALELIKTVALPEMQSILPLRFEAVASNPNAYSFQMLMALASILALGAIYRQAGKSPLWLNVLGGIILIGLWYSLSRAGWISAIVLLATAYIFKLDEYRNITKTILISIAGIFLMELVTILANQFQQGIGGYRRSGDVIQFIYQEENDGLRLESLIGGIEMWLGNPLFGGGLGGFIHNYYAQNNVSLVIHNTPIWILAEFGIIGFALFFYAAIEIFRTAILRCKKGADAGSLLVVLIFVAMSSVFMFHDMMFQRTFWLLLGAGLAFPVKRQKTGFYDTGEKFFRTRS